MIKPIINHSTGFSNRFESQQELLQHIGESGCNKVEIEEFTREESGYETSSSMDTSGEISLRTCNMH